MTEIVKTEEKKEDDRLLGLFEEFDPSKAPQPRVQSTEASLEFAGLAATIGGVLHKPQTYDDKLIHSNIDKGLELDVTITSAIPYTMSADYFYLIKDSRKAEVEFKELQKKEPKIPEEEAIEALYSTELMEQEVTDQAEWDEYWEQVIEAWRIYGFERAVVESRILTEDDMLAWKVMTPFCFSLPEKYAETSMAKEGKRAEHGVQNIGSILHRETMNNDSGTLDKLREKLHLNRR